jgi:hypothetical protein
MNYYILQSKFFIVFIAIAAMSFAAIPFMKNSFADVTDIYVRNQMNLIQSEMLFVDIKKDAFINSCTRGIIGEIIQETIQYTSSVRCKTNPPLHSKMIVCAAIRNNSFYCVDYLGVSCELSHQPKKGFSCKDI